MSNGTITGILNRASRGDHARRRTAKRGGGATRVSLSSEMLSERIEAVLKTLTHREREIIKLRYGIGDGYTYTLEEVGKTSKSPASASVRSRPRPSASSTASSMARTTKGGWLRANSPTTAQQ